MLFGVLIDMDLFLAWMAEIIRQNGMKGMTDDGPSWPQGSDGDPFPPLGCLLGVTIL